MVAPLFSVIVPTCHRPEALAQCLAALGAQDFSGGDFEVIVVNDDEMDCRVAEVTAIFQERLALTLLARPPGGYGAARNTGLVRARGEFVAFTGDDCRPARNWLTALGRHLRARPGAAVAGAVVNARPENLCASVTQMLLDHCHERLAGSTQTTRFYTPNNLAFPTEALRAVGAFNEALRMGEDRELCARWQRTGRELHFAADAVVDHDHPLTLPAFLHKHYAYAHGGAQFRRVAFHEARAGWRLESLSFYLGLLRRPLATQAFGARALAGTVLMFLSQVAAAAGFARGWMEKRPAC